MGPLRGGVMLLAAVAAGACTGFHEAEGDGGNDGGGASDAADARPHVRDAGHGEDHPREAAAQKGPCDAGACPAEVVVPGLEIASVIVIDSENVYVSDQGTFQGDVYQCPKSGCGKPIHLGTGQATGIVVTGGVVYWSDLSSGNIYGCAIGGCDGAPSAVVTGQGMPSGLGYDGERFYWSTGAAVVTRGSLQIGPTTTLVTGVVNEIDQIVSWGGSAFWVDSLVLETCRFTGCARDTAKDLVQSIGGAVAVADSQLYFVNNNEVVTCPASASTCVPRTIGTSFDPVGVASDGVNVYWLDVDANFVFRCPVAGCEGEPERFANSQQAQNNANIAMDDDYIYWSDSESVLRKHK